MYSSDIFLNIIIINKSILSSKFISTGSKNLVTDSIKINKQIDNKKIVLRNLLKNIPKSIDNFVYEKNIYVLKNRSFTTDKLKEIIVFLPPETILHL